jgi:hypothetical protein
VLASAVAVAVQKRNAWEKPLLGICVEKKSTPPVAMAMEMETSAQALEAKRVSAWDKAPSLLFDSPPPRTQAIKPEAVAVAVAQKPVSQSDVSVNIIREEVSAMELCQNCFFYGQCNRNPARLHLQDSGFPAAAKAFEKTFAETKVCLKGFFEPEKCKFGSACHRLHKGDARLTAGVITAFRSFYIRTTAQLSGRPLSSCRVNRSHDHRFCYFLHKEDSCNGSKASNHVCRHPAAAEKKVCRVANSKAAVATKSQFAILDESSDTDEYDKDNDKDNANANDLVSVSKDKMADAKARPALFTSSLIIEAPSCTASNPLAKSGVRRMIGVSKAPGSTSWAALTDSDDEDDYGDDNMMI